MKVRAVAGANAAPYAGTGVPGSETSVVLVCPRVATVVLPWWPTEVSRSGLVRDWEEMQRPGRQPLMLSPSRRLGEYNLGFTLRHATYGTSVRGIVNDLESIAASETPVALVIARTSRGLFHVTEFDPVEVDHDTNGQPATVDVSMTLKRASDATVNVGLIKRIKGRGSGFAKKKR